jgi:predicted Holliday junction resolvase-like endonuclease
VEKSNHPLLIATILMSMVLEQRKLVTALQAQLEKLQQEVQSGQRAQAAESSRLKEDIQHLDEDVDSRLRALRAELSEILYPSDGAL